MNGLAHCDFSPNTGAGSYIPGGLGSGLWFVLNRWHEMGRHGTWLVTMSIRSGYGLWVRPNGNYNAVVDDFGNLVIVGDR